MAEETEVRCTKCRKTRRGVDPETFVCRYCLCTEGEVVGRRVPLLQTGAKFVMEVEGIEVTDCGFVDGFTLIERPPVPDTPEELAHLSAKASGKIEITLKDPGDVYEFFAQVKEAEERQEVIRLRGLLYEVLQCFAHGPFEEVTIQRTCLTAVQAEDPVPVIACPECGYLQEDFDGFGFLYCPRCETCRHPSVTDGVCGLCGKERP